MKKIILLAIIILVGILLLGLIYYSAFTNKGSDFVVRLIMRDYVETSSVNIDKTSGALLGTLVYENMEFHDLKWLPAGNLVKIQRLEVSVESFSLQGVRIKITNGRLNFSNTETVL
ncbi:MAG: hypothetical protein HQL29_05075, partial [Candidatus Omnitrophica bacterium]|nr:hypothetical protein [Candidatus Omnitrophota bacterium]